MRRFSFALLLALTVCLFGAGCHSAVEEPPAPSPSATALPTPEPTPVPTPSILSDRAGEEVPLSQVDFAAYEDFLEPEDWEALSGFFPVLVEGEPFLTQGYPGKKEDVSFQEIVLSDFFTSLTGEPNEYCPASFALFDCNGDGQQELALWSGHSVGWYIVLLREEETFYGCYMPVRWFGWLQKDGVAWGSGGADTGGFAKLHFEDGRFWQESFAGQYEGHFYIGESWSPEIEISEETFDLWCQENLAGNAVWYAAVPKG